MASTSPQLSRGSRRSCSPGSVVCKQPQSVVANGTPRGRLLVFAVLYFAYSGYMICRKGYSFWLPHLIQEAGLTNVSVGSLGSAFQVCGAIAKVGLAVFVDTHSPTLVLGGALLLSAGTNVGMCWLSLSTSSGGTVVWAMALLWGLNGAAQAIGWPALARIFMAWYEPTERGKWYGLLSTNQNAGAAAVPLIVAATSQLSGSWRAAGFLAPAAVGFVLAVLVLTLLTDEPPYREADKTLPPPVHPVKEAHDKDGDEQLSQFLRREVFANKSVLLLGLAYICVSVLRHGLGDWAVKLLAEQWHLNESAAAACLLFLEIGGFVGSLGAGVLSDEVCGKQPRASKNRGPYIYMIARPSFTTPRSTFLPTAC